MKKRDHRREHEEELQSRRGEHIWRKRIDRMSRRAIWRCKTCERTFKEMHADRDPYTYDLADFDIDPDCRIEVMRLVMKS